MHWNVAAALGKGRTDPFQCECENFWSCWINRGSLIHASSVRDSFHAKDKVWQFIKVCLSFFCWFFAWLDERFGRH